MAFRGNAGANAGRFKNRYLGIDKKRLGERLKEERLRRHLTQEELSEIVELTPAFIGHIERGDRSLSLDTLVKLCNALGVTIDYLLSDTLSPKDDDVTEEIRALLKDKTIRQKAAMLDIMRAVSRNI